MNCITPIATAQCTNAAVRLNIHARHAEHDVALTATSVNKGGLYGTKAERKRVKFLSLLFSGH